MRSLGTWFRHGLGTAGLIVGLMDLKGLFQLKLSCDFHYSLVGIAEFLGKAAIAHSFSSPWDTVSRCWVDVLEPEVFHS